MGPRAGQRVVRFRGIAAGRQREPQQKQTPGYGFNLHAKRSVAAKDRKGLDRLCQYILRPPVSNQRLSLVDGARVSLELKRPWSDGTTHMVFTLMELMQRLVALVFPPGFNRLRYQGVFAPRATLRPQVIPPTPEDADCAHGAKDDGDSLFAQQRRMDWARLLARVFKIDVLECPKCKSRMQRIAFITTGDAIKKILECVGLPADSPQPRRPAQQLDLL